LHWWTGRGGGFTTVPQAREPGVIPQQNWAEHLPLKQIQLDDRFKVLESGTKGAQHGHKGKKLEYRIRHKDGSWRVLEPITSTIRDEKGEVARIRSQDTLSDRRRQADVIAVLGIRRAEQSKP
jgi:hypothetical protein